MTDGPNDRCTCCARPWRLIDNQAAKGWGHGQVCPPCVAHAGNPLQEVREHRSLSAALLDQVEAAHDAEIGQKNDTIRSLQKQLDDRPVREVERVINQEAFSELHADIERAFRQRDTAYETVIELLLIHRLDAEQQTCKCGKPAAACDVAELLEDARDMVRGWERKQIELLQRGLEHRLPANHPAVLDRRTGIDHGIA